MMSSYSYQPEPTALPKLEKIGKCGSSIKTYNTDGIGAETSVPVHLPVDKQTGIAVEIFAVTLQDSHCALVVGTGNTFGTGRIKNAQPLNGSGVAVTMVRHVTPSRGGHKYVWFYPLVERIQNIIP